MPKQSYELKEIHAHKSHDKQEETRGGNKTEKKDSEEEKKSATFRELFRYSRGKDKLLIVIGSIFAIGHGAAWPALAIVFGRMTNIFLGGSAVSRNESSSINVTTGPQDLNEQITGIMIQFVYIGVGVFVTTYFQISLWVSASERQTHKIRQHFFHAILRQDMGWRDKRQSGELTTRLADDLERIREGLGEKVSLCLQLFATFFGGYGVGFWHSWKMTLVLLSLMPLLAASGAFLSKRVTSFARREQKAYAAAGSIAEEVLSCIRTVVSFNGQQREHNRYSEALEQGKWLGIKKSAITGLGIGSMFLVMFSAYALAFWYGSTLVAEFHESGGVDGISPGTVFTVVFSVIMGTMSLGNVAPYVTVVMTAKGAGAKVMEIIDRVPPIDSTSGKGKKPKSVEGNIELRGVEFAYPTRDDIKTICVDMNSIMTRAQFITDPCDRTDIMLSRFYLVLKDFSLSIKHGQTVALVGTSGCGKSTIINLILRFYDPLAGNVFLDGCNLKELNPAWLRQQIGFVSQEPTLFDCSIRENIKLGELAATDDQVMRAARRANAHSFISELPKGYDTLVGERGAQLSGGQKQRIAIARALIRDPKILLLDEATSALDVESEGIVQKALDKAREGRTTVIIAHRLSTVKNADDIYVIKEGAIVEHGCHRTLMTQRGEYYELVTGQTFEIDEDEDNDSGADNLNDADNMTSDGDIGNGHIPIKRRVSKMKMPNSKQQTNVKKSDETAKDKKDEAKQSTFIRMLRSNSPEWLFILGGCLGAMIGGSIMPLFAVFFSMVLKTLGESDPDLIRSETLKWSLLFLTLGVISFFGNLIKNMMFGQSGERLTKRLRLQSFKGMLRQDIAYFDDHDNASGSLTTRLATDASLINSATGIRMGVVTQSTVCIVAALAVAFFFGWKLTLVILASLPLMAVSAVINMKTAYKDQKKGSKDVQNARKVAGEAIENIRTVQSLTREQHFFEKYRTFLRDSHKKAIRQAQFYGISYGFSQAILFFIYGVAFRFGAYLISEGEMQPPEVYSALNPLLIFGRVFLAITLSGMVIGQSMAFLPEYTKARSAAGRIFDIIDKVPSIDSESTTGKQVKKTEGEIELENVTFRYPTRPDIHVLSNLTLHIRPGLTTALVGVSGCGKSTVMSLIQRYYDAESGRVLLDGVDIKTLSVKSLRSVLSVVSQEPVLFACSIRDNILYGLEEGNVTMDKVIAAARMANIHEFISSLPNGYDTEVGEKGTQLSGGQKQRVAIARAIIRNPRVLLLDEATSALDSESEKLVQAALDNAKAGRTCLVIAHRLSTIQNADHICVITDGQISEQGTHAELVLRKGLYADLVSGQQIAR